MSDMTPLLTSRDRDNLEVARETRQLVAQTVASHASVGFDPTQGTSKSTVALQAEDCIKLAMQEYNFSFATRELDEYEAMLICERGYRRIVIASAVDKPTDRIFLYLHMLAHVAYDHVDKNEFGVRLEVLNRRILPRKLHYQEFIADMWAEDVLRQLACGDNLKDGPFLATLRTALRDNQTGLSRIHHKIHYIFEDLYVKHPWLVDVRRQVAVDLVLTFLYHRLDTNRATLPLLSPARAFGIVGVLQNVFSDRTPSRSLESEPSHANLTATPSSGGIRE